MTNVDQQYSFRGQRPDETVVLVTKQHVWLFLPALGVWLGLIILLMGLFWIFGASRTTSIGIVVVAIIGGLHTLYIWYIWNNSDYVVTNQRVLKIDQVGFFNRVISEAEINRIQEISTEVKGPVRTVLNFGTVQIKTASDAGKMDLDDVTDPYSVQQAIVSIQKKSDSHQGVRIL